MSESNVVPLREGAEAAIRASINVRAAELGTPDAIRRKWLGKAFSRMRDGASIGEAISEAVRGMRRDTVSFANHLAAQ